MALWWLLLLALHLLLELRVLLLVRRFASRLLLTALLLLRALLLSVEDRLRALVGVSHSKLRHPLLRQTPLLIRQISCWRRLGIVATATAT